MRKYETVLEFMLWFAMFNYIGYWVAKFMIFLNVSFKVYTTLGVSFITYGIHIVFIALSFFCALKSTETNSKMK